MGELEMTYLISNRPARWFFMASVDQQMGKPLQLNHINLYICGSLKNASYEDP